MRAEFTELAEKVNNWGRWGADDERGALNFVTPDVVKSAAYNGAPIASLTAKGAGRCGIDKVGALVSRGVLHDVARAKGLDRLEPGYALTAADLDEASEFAEVTAQLGDMLLVCTGHIQHLHGDKMAYAFPSPGFSMQTARWLHEHEVAAVANDTIVCECLPGEYEDLPLPVHLLHRVEMGLTQGQNWDPAALAADCAEDGQNDFLPTATPEPFVEGLGAPVAPVVVK